MSLEDFLAGKADVVIPLEREGCLSITEVLATRSWFDRRRNVGGVAMTLEEAKEIVAKAARDEGLAFNPAHLAKVVQAICVVESARLNPLEEEPER